MPAYSSEVELRSALGIESWRNLSKDKFIHFLGELPHQDPAVALKVIEQMPELKAMAASVLDDAAEAYNVTLASNDGSLAKVHHIQNTRLEILRREIEKDLSPKQWTRVLDDIRDVEANVLLKDSENKRFLSEQLDKKLMTAGLVALAFAGIVLGAGKASDKPLLGADFSTKP